METELVGSTQLLTDERPGSDKPLTAYEQSQVPIENPSVNEQPNNTPIENPPVNEQPNNTPIEKPGFVGTYKKYIVIGLIVLLILLVIFAATKFPTRLILSGISIVIVPDCVIGLFNTVYVLLFMSTLVTVPLAFNEDAIVICPVEPLSSIPAPAVSLVTPVLVMLIVPVLVIGLPVTAIPSPSACIATLVTVPTEAVLLILVILPYASTVKVGAI